MANPLDTLNSSAQTTDSGLSEAEKAAATDFYSTATAQMTSGKGSKFGMPKYTGDVPVSESVLENMQRLLYEKEQGRGSLANTLQDVLAIFPGDPTLRSQSIGARNAQRLQEEADIFNLQQGISSGETAREQAKIAGKNLQAFTQGTGGGGGAGGGGMPPGMQAGIDPTVLQRVDQLNNEGKREQASKLLQTALLDVNKAKSTARLGKDFYMPDIQVEDPNNPGKTKYVSVADIQGGNYRPTAQGMATYKNAVSAGTGNVNAENIKTVESRGVPGLVSPKGAEGVMQVMPNTQTNPGFGVTPAKDKSQAELERVGRDYYDAMQKRYGHDTLAAIAYNMGPGQTDTWLNSGADFKKLPKETQSYIAQVNLANALQGRAQNNRPSVGLTSEQKGAGAASEAADKAFRDNLLKPLAERVNVQRNDKLYADMAIDSLNTGNFGPGSSIGQMTKEAAQALGIPLSPKEREEYFNKLTIEQVKQNFVASSARAAMGAQFTQVESERFAKTLAGINDPKEYIKTVYQIKKALAEIDEAKYDYLVSNKQGLDEANKEWRKTGIPEKIMRETVDKFRGLPVGGESKTPSGNAPIRRSLNDMPKG